MGVTIYYRGNLKNPKDIPAITAELEDICRSAEWSYRIYDDSNTELKKLPFRGITFQPHSKSESVWMIFLEDGSLFFPLGTTGDELSGEPIWAFTKTQFAGADVHIALCRLLKYLSERWFESFEVVDDGGYWEDNNAEELNKRIGIINEAITAIEEGLSSLPLQKDESAESRIKKILDALQKKRNKE